MNTRILILAFTLLPTLSFADTLVDCSNAEGNLIYKSTLQVGGTRPAGSPNPIPTVKLTKNGIEVSSPHATFSGEQPIYGAPSDGGSAFTKIYSARLSFQFESETLAEFVICREKTIFYP